MVHREMEIWRDRSHTSQEEEEEEKRLEFHAGARNISLSIIIDG